ncbi:MarR family winged helix-turn-helix transcriptional regulator [Fictibacillus terranigra]|uniref:MarR family transcriptional regulator n=1 Tax=Fictibacillus terranigra TaxID=3058424 RepID=A0ABT8E1X3_9BACL|nr:MarR family transcriptional regulator [Fictibacillus sp. CENA-BCM004]MDN4071918.1 MarR family transcriptional regulator [Fictibacillus sp. CENA-BCM004]
MDVSFFNELWTDLYYLLHYRHEEKLTHQNVRCMQAVKKKKDATVADVADVLQVTHHSASEHVKRLIDKGYLEKERSASDKRTVFVKLTVLGEDALKRNTELDEQKLQAVLDRLSKDEQKSLMDAFEKLRTEAKHVYGR